jgi:uncharacterized protein (TIGR02596 family)
MVTKRRRQNGAFPTAFTLLEVLVVMVVVVILITLAARGMSDVLTSTRLDEAGRMVADEINLARQTAVATNELVQVRFMKLPRSSDAETPVFWQIQSGTLQKEDNAFKPLKAPSRFPTGVIMATPITASPLLSGSLATNVHPGYDYKSLNIRPTGEIEPVGSPAINELSKWCITVISEKHAGKPIDEVANLVTIQINPLTARTGMYKP